MNIFLLAETAIFIQIHLVVAILAILIGGYQLLANKGTDAHRLIGRA